MKQYWVEIEDLEIEDLGLLEHHKDSSETSRAREAGVRRPEFLSFADGPWASIAHLPTSVGVSPSGLWEIAVEAFCALKGKAKRVPLAGEARPSLGMRGDRGGPRGLEILGPRTCHGLRLWGPTLCAFLLL